MTLPPPGEVYRFTTDQYDRMVRDGTIAEDDPVELLNGIVVRKMPKGPRHDASFARCRRQIEPFLAAGWYLRLEGSVRIPDYDEPEPDLCVVRGDSDDFTDHHPGPGDVALIVEVADSSLVQGPRRETRQLWPRRDSRLLDRRPRQPPARGLRRPGRRGLPGPDDPRRVGVGRAGHRRPAPRPDRRRRPAAEAAMTGDQIVPGVWNRHNQGNLACASGL